MSRFSKVLDRLLPVVIILISIFCFTGCSKIVDQVGPAEKVGLTFNIGGIYDDSSNGSLLASAGGNNLFLEGGDQAQVNNVSKKNGNIVVDMITEEGRIIEPFNSNDGGENKKVAATFSNMSNGIHYRVLIYTETNNTFVASVEGIVGTPLRVTVPSGQSYKWYAYSFNSTAQIPDPTSAPNSPSNPSITTPYTTTLLYTSNTTGTINANGTPISITFKHQLTQLNVELDARGMFADVTTLNANFESDYVKVSSFNLLTGQKEGQLTSVSIPQLVFTSKDEGSDRVKVAKYYTANSSLTEYSIRVTALTVRYPNNTVEDMMSKVTGNGIITFGTYGNSNVGYSLKGLVKLWLILPTKHVLSYGSLTGYGYAAEQGYASGNFLRNSYNFGTTSDYFKIQNLTFSQQSALAGNLATLLATPANYPDVIVMGIFGGYANAADYTALRTYLNAGGVVFFMTENVDTQTLNFLKGVLNSTSITIRNDDTGGSIYALADVDPDVLDGVFGDIRGKFWGQDGSATLYINGYTGNDIVAYSGASSNNNPPTVSGITMFRHKLMNLFYVGDTGFLANNMANGTYLPSVYYNIGPFGTIGGTDPNRSFPNVRMYGHYATSGSPLYADPANRNVFFPIYNSFLFGNVFAWLLEKAYFNGIN